ncbi:MAG: deoxyhypusine synthase family protein, partial [Pirellulales bacterium]
MTITEFLDHHFRHFNARETVAASKAWIAHLDSGGKMMLTLAGAMSTAELGISLARMIREDKVHAICSTAANFEEDFFNLLAHDEYYIASNYRDLSPADEAALCEKGFNRVTDTCIPETVIRHLEGNLIDVWQAAINKSESYFPYEYFFQLLDQDRLSQHYQIPPEHSWVIAAWEKKIPIYTPGWEDSTLGNVFTARCIEERISLPADARFTSPHQAIKSGTQQLEHLVHWYQATDREHSIGFFQIGGGIAGDFPICAVPLMRQDMELDIRHWGYFCQISDSTTSYGSYSGAVPNEKITWDKLDVDAPKFMINSDASIVAPLVFAYVLG